MRVPPTHTAAPSTGNHRGRHAAPQQTAPSHRNAAIALALAGALIPLVGTLPHASATGSTTFALAPVADASVYSSSKTLNTSRTATLDVDRKPLTRSYLSFSVPDGGTITRAVLQLSPLVSNGVGVDVHSTGDFSESTITYTNAPAVGTLLAHSGPITSGSATSLDISSFVQAGGTFDFVLTTSSASLISFASHESSTPPQLILTTLSPAPVASATASPSPTATTSPAPSPTASPTASPTPSPSTSSTLSARKLHIHHGWDLAYPSQIATHAALIDSRPIDGITVCLSTLTDDTLSGTAHSAAEYVNALAPMPIMANVTHNFVVVRTMHPFDWYSDAQWTTVATNVGNLAAAAKAKSQFDGIFLDTEWYGSGTYPWDFGAGSAPWTYSATAGATPGHTAADAQSTVRSRGLQFGDAVAAAWPSAVVISSYGPWVGETKTASSGGWGSFGYSDTAWTNELMGVFVGGLVSAATAHPTMTYVDGGEVYQAHSTSEYATAYQWMKSGLAASGSPVVPDASTYGSSVNAGFGVFDKDMRLSGWPTMPASQWQTVLTNALHTSDRYVWSYSEAYDWLGTGWPSTPVPADILAATRAAMTAA